ncbi:hypothetical protein D3C71_1556230 [compost metagenome]
MLEHEKRRRRIRQPAGFNDHVAKRLDPAADRQHEELAQGVDHRATDHAAQAAAFDKHDIGGRQSDQMMVHTNVAILVDDNDGIRIGGLVQQAVKQRGLAATQKTGEHCHADAPVVFLSALFLLALFQPIVFHHSPRKNQKEEKNKKGHPLSRVALLFGLGQ